MTVSVHGLRKRYESHRRSDDPVEALQGVDLTADETELVVVVGPSGSGKSTLLRCIAGLERLDEGRIEVGGRDVTNELPGDRDVAMVFQEYALYPHMAVAANIAFPLRARKLERGAIDAKVHAVAEMLGLDHVLGRRPAELSGGERQRVALARAIVREPKAFLMDEPLSDLDAELRTHTRAEIRLLQRRLGTTMLYVTHDQVEAMTMGDRVAVLRDGRLEQVDAPMVLYDQPANAFVARFIGSPPMNLFPADLHRGPDGAAILGVRPERVHVVPTDQGRLKGRVVDVEHVGNESIVHVDVGGHRIIVRMPPEEAPSVEADVGLTFRDADLHGFESDDGRALP